ncbi:hypothetical protein BDV24DRAFT_144131 [Aspergillus arachidicola]|uniref:Uncharacterized protein n=1 Tax=Aspergillus arachidicola TaxID=656916 RepID=A0A5N6XQ29_9EURO|nr:hypothetical protein BDV24DRAFT_144131 [Aspergillus arachidicola]
MGGGRVDSESLLRNLGNSLGTTSGCNSWNNSFVDALQSQPSTIGTSWLGLVAADFTCAACQTAGASAGT